MDPRGSLPDLMIALFMLYISIELLFASNAEVICKENEREALLTFKQGILDEENVLSSWGVEEDKKECCGWSGVECSNITGDVIRLDLSNRFIGYPVFNSKTGSALLELNHLLYLDLSNNKFDGSEIPNFIGSMTKLEQLILASSNFGGMVPYQLGNLVELRTLDVRFNGLTSDNLNWLSNLSSLSSLLLTSNQFAGSFPDLNKFVLLTELSVGHNYITELPPSIGQLRNLEILDVSHNSLKGTISVAHFSELSNLKYLDLSFNSLEGEVSEAHLSKLHLLKYLSLSHNNLALNVNSYWIPPFHLDRIELADCSMGPHFPAWLQTQSNFSVLDISSNDILGDVPIWFWDLSSQMTYLNLSYNKLTGLVPDLPSNFTFLSPSDFNLGIDLSSNQFYGNLPLFHSSYTTLALSNNMFSGTIQSICSNFKLESLDLSANALFGDIPNCWGDMPYLLTLRLGSNNFSGYIPPTFGALSSLEILNFQYNNVFGGLPSTMENCTTLKQIYGAGNRLQGKIPIWIGTLPSLTILILRGNNFSGSIPRELCQLNQITFLDLSGNNLSGRIPHCFNNFSSMMDYSTSEITSTGVVRQGPRTLAGGSLSFLQNYFTPNSVIIWTRKRQSDKIIDGFTDFYGVDISSNNIVGSIPPEISLMRQLRYLNLSHNYLTGKISSDIGQMERLESLDLSNNQLSGGIPPTMEKLFYLSMLNLSNNNFSGKIPMVRQLSTFENSSYIGNKELCGFPMTVECTNDAPSNHLKRHDDTSDASNVSFPCIFGYWELWVIYYILLPHKITFLAVHL